MMHIGLIMDGNRRWAKFNNIDLVTAYNRGAEVFIEFLKWASETNIVKYCTAYALSSNNFLRQECEKEIIFSVFINFLKKYLSEIEKYNAKILFIGNRNRLPQEMQILMNVIEHNTVHNKKYYVQIVIDYNTEWYIENIIKQNKHPINDFPQIDLLIRSAGEKRLSDYMLFLLQYAELDFIDTLWPDCNHEIFNRSLINFQKRNRRYGK